MSRAEVFQIIEDVGIGYEYSGIPTDKISLKVNDLKAVLEYVESVTEAVANDNTENSYQE